MITIITIISIIISITSLTSIITILTIGVLLTLRLDGVRVGRRALDDRARALERLLVC